MLREVLSSIESSTLLSNDRLPFTTPVLPDVLAICWNVLSGFAIIKAKLALIIKGNHGTRTSRFEEMTSAKVSGSHGQAGFCATP
jgi:hypothetical protein